MASRLFVQEAIADKFIEGLAAAFKSIDSAGIIGDPTLPTTLVGPIADKTQFKRVMELIDVGKEDGTLVTGGAQRGEKGLFVQPTIFRDTPVTSRIVQEEVFGPVVTVQTFGTEEEGVAMANDSVFGLSGKQGGTVDGWGIG
jgi:aldehyde dehydrogenase (NAD+)